MSEKLSRSFYGSFHERFCPRAFCNRLQNILTQVYQGKCGGKFTESVSIP